MTARSVGRERRDGGAAAWTQAPRPELDDDEEGGPMTGRTG